MVNQYYARNVNGVSHDVTGYAALLGKYRGKSPLGRVMLVRPEIIRDIIDDRPGGWNSVELRGSEVSLVLLAVIEREKCDISLGRHCYLAQK